MTAEIPIVDPAVRRSLGDISRGDISLGAQDFALARVTRGAAFVIGLASAAVGVQAVAHALTAPQADLKWWPALIALVYVPLILLVAACVTGRFVRPVAVMFTCTFPVALVIWPLATASMPVALDSQPPVWYLLNVATSATVLVYRMRLQIVWAIGVPVLYVIARTIQLGAPQGEVVFVVLDGVFAMILAGVILTIAWMLRTVATGIDRARADAVASYADAAAADAAEGERVAIAALMHDSVLAALIAAERADSDRERALAVSMAREALTRLANADRESGEGSDAPVSAEQLADAIDCTALENQANVVATRVITPGSPSIPGRVARALTLASGQAIANAMQHAGGAGLAVSIHADPNDIEVLVSDAGDGFDPEAVPDDRLGIRGSISARMAAVAGTAEIVSAPSGTSVRLTWRYEK